MSTSTLSLSSSPFLVSLYFPTSIPLDPQQQPLWIEGYWSIVEAADSAWGGMEINAVVRGRVSDAGGVAPSVARPAPGDYQGPCVLGVIYREGHPPSSPPISIGPPGPFLLHCVLSAAPSTRAGVDGTATAEHVPIVASLQLSGQRDPIPVPQAHTILYPGTPGPAPHTRRTAGPRYLEVGSPSPWLTSGLDGEQKPSEDAGPLGEPPGRRAAAWVPHLDPGGRVQHTLSLINRCIDEVTLPSGSGRLAQPSPAAVPWLEVSSGLTDPSTGRWALRSRLYEACARQWKQYRGSGPIDCHGSGPGRPEGEVLLPGGVPVPSWCVRLGAALGRWEGAMDRILGLVMGVVLTAFAGALSSHVSHAYRSVYGGLLPRLYLWLGGSSPGGIKLHRDLAPFLAWLALSSCSLALEGPAWVGRLVEGTHLAPLLTPAAAFGVAAGLGVLWGARASLALLSDLVLGAGAPILALHAATSALYRAHLLFLGFSWGLVRGRRPVEWRGRVRAALGAPPPPPSAPAEGRARDAVVVGNLLFAVAAFLLPTVGLFHLAAAAAALGVAAAASVPRVAAAALIESGGVGAAPALAAALPYLVPSTFDIRVRGANGRELVAVVGGGVNRAPPPLCLPPRVTGERTLLALVPRAEPLGAVLRGSVGLAVRIVGWPSVGAVVKGILTGRPVISGRVA